MRWLALCLVASTGCSLFLDSGGNTEPVDAGPGPGDAADARPVPTGEPCDPTNAILCSGFEDPASEWLAPLSRTDTPTFSGEDSALFSADDGAEDTTFANVELVSSGVTRVAFQLYIQANTDDFALFEPLSLLGPNGLSAKIAIDNDGNAFAKVGAANAVISGAVVRYSWQCIELRIDADSDTAQLFVGGIESPAAEGASVAPFDEIEIGIGAGGTFTTLQHFMDDLVVTRYDASLCP